MELKPKYQYSYFIKPYVIKQDEYATYLQNLMQNEKIKIKNFEKEKDMDIYAYFLPQIRNYVFPSFSQKENKQNMAEKPVVHFSYDLTQNILVKEKTSEKIIFGIHSIDLMCFQTGICFLILKTYLENMKDFSDILNFNYKFRELNSDFFGFKKYERINLAVDNFSSMEELKNLMKNLVGNVVENEGEDDNFYVYSYACVDGEIWNSDADFEKLKFDFYRFANALPSSYTGELNLDSKEGMKILDKWDCIRIGMTQNTTVLLTSSINTYHYTNLPHKFENEYLYTFLIDLYQKLYLKQMAKELTQKGNIRKKRKAFNQFIKYIWSSELTKDETGSLLYQHWKSLFHLDNLYLETMNLYDTRIKEYNDAKNQHINHFLWLIVVICLLINLIDFGILLSIK